jgi:branched-chain amino acid transport system substrate-binding protein
MRKFWKTGAALLVSASMLAGCGSSTSGTDSSSSDGTSGEATGDVVKIGLNFELSGNVSDYGTKELRGATIAIEQWNAREDKPFTVEAVEIDDKGEPAESITAITKLIEQDGVVGVVGPATSASSIATYDFASSKSVPVISPSATQVDAMMKSDGEPYEYAWRVCFEDSAQGEAMALYAHDYLDATKAVIFNEVSDYGQGLADAFTEEFESLGGTIVDQIQYNSGDKDFSSYITKIQGMDYDVIYIAGYYNEAAQIVKAAKADGIDKPIVGSDGMDSTDFTDQLGSEYANNVFYTTAYTAADPSDELKTFIEDYKAKYGDEPSMFAALAYDATNLLLSSLEATGETGEALNEEIKNVSYDGITGSFSFDTSTHTPKKDVLVVELVDGVQSNVTKVNAD